MIWKAAFDYVVFDVSGQVLKDIEERRADICNLSKNGSAQPRGKSGTDRTQQSPVLPAVAYGQNQVLLRASSAVDVHVTRDKGRHLLANRAMKAGDVLIVEKPYAAVLLPSQYDTLCHHCFTPVTAAVPCVQCTCVRYCSEVCRKASWEACHRVECKFMDLLHAIVLAQKWCRMWQDGEIIGDNVAYIKVKLVLDGSSARIVHSSVLSSSCCCLWQHCNIVRWAWQDQSQIPMFLQCFETVGWVLRPIKMCPQYDLEKFYSAEGSVMEPGSEGGIGTQLLGSTDGTYACNYTAVYHLMTHSENMPPEDLFQYTLTAYLLLLVLDEADFFNSGTGENSMENTATQETTVHNITDMRAAVGELLLRHTCQLVCNAHAITDIQRSSAASSSASLAMSSTETSDTCVVDTSRQVRLATAIYPTASLMNHSCDPSIISSFCKDVLVVRAVKDIAAGDEIFNCYGPHCKRMSREERRWHLSEQYYFDCNCSACTRPIEHELYFDALRCRVCCGPVVPSRDQHRCLQCGELMTDVRSILQAVMQAHTLWRKAVKQLDDSDLATAELTLERCLRLREVCLHEQNKGLAEVHDALARCQVMLGKCVSAARHLSASLSTTEAVYGGSSIELANELMKYAEVCLVAEQRTAARSAAERARTLFELNYGCQCQPVAELNELLNQLSLSGAPPHTEPDLSQSGS